MLRVLLLLLGQVYYRLRLGRNVLEYQPVGLEVAPADERFHRALATATAITPTTTTTTTTTTTNSNNGTNPQQ